MDKKDILTRRILTDERQYLNIEIVSKILSNIASKYNKIISKESKNLNISSLQSFFNDPKFDDNLKLDMQSLDAVATNVAAIYKHRLTPAAISQKFSGYAKWKIIELNTKVNRMVGLNLAKLRLQKNSLLAIKQTKERLQEISKQKDTSEIEKQIEFNSAFNYISQVVTLGETQKENREEKDDLKKHKKPTYVDNIKKSEQSYINYYKYDEKNNEYDRISIDEKINELQNRFSENNKYFERLIAKTANDAEVVRDAKNIKSSFVNFNQECIFEINEIDNLLERYKFACNLRENEKSLVSLIQRQKQKYKELIKVNKEKAILFEQGLTENKEKYEEIAKSSIDNYVKNNATLINGQSPLSQNLENFILMGQALNGVQLDCGVKKDYADKQKTLYQLIEKELSEEMAGTQHKKGVAEIFSKNKLFDIDSVCRKFSEGSEDFKRNLADNSTAVSDLVKMAATGNYFDGTKNVEIPEEKNNMIFHILQNIYEFKLEKQGLAKIEYKTMDKGRVCRTVKFGDKSRIKSSMSLISQLQVEDIKEK